ncbi:hypothetical protein LXH13_04250 [Streptomyces spinosirectus]|jgi:hypothetical protein|uniref:hypothetical protein n=1 Tax=Streptomyces TaxID=1883 RepID=UPI001F1DBB1C|nr:MULTISPECIES: hypothetical protein [Streptomyces]UIR23198.1 hypothetical protein LXH13_04250 [Streptomyces spinosirectus]
MTSSRGAWDARAEEEANGAGEPDADDADEAETVAALDIGTVTAAASTAFTPVRRVTRCGFGTETPRGRRPDEAEHTEIGVPPAVDMVLTIVKVPG